MIITGMEHFQSVCKKKLVHVSITIQAESKAQK